MHHAFNYHVVTLIFNYIAKKGEQSSCVKFECKTSRFVRWSNTKLSKFHTIPKFMTFTLNLQHTETKLHCMHNLQTIYYFFLLFSLAFPVLFIKNSCQFSTKLLLAIEKLALTRFHSSWLTVFLGKTCKTTTIQLDFKATFRWLRKLWLNWNEVRTLL